MNQIDKKRILIVNPFGIGDVLFTMPLVKTLKAIFRDSYIGYLCNIRTAPLLSTQPEIDKVFIYEKDEYRELWKASKRRCAKQLIDLLKEIRNESYDLVFDLSLAREYGLFLRLAKIEKRIGYNYRKRGIFLTDRIDLPNGYSDKHMVDYYLDLLALAGINKRADGISISIPDKIKKDAEDMLKGYGISKDESFVCIAPGAGASWGDRSFRKQWPREKFSDIVYFLLKNYDTKILLLGSGSDDQICEFVKAKNSRCINLCKKTDLMSFAAIISMTKLLITNDGGPLHLAVAADVKSISIFGPVDDIVYGPYKKNSRHVVVKNTEIDCRPCYKNFRLAECDNLRCIEDIPKENVMEAVKRLCSLKGKVI